MPSSEPPAAPASAPADASAPSGETPAPSSDANAAPPANPPGGAPLPDGSGAHAPGAGAQAKASGPNPYAFMVGLRLAYEVPIGLAGGYALNEVLSGAVPIVVDAGYFVTPNLYVGGYFAYGFGLNATAGPTCPDDDGTTCNASLIRFGAAAHWHFAPRGKLDPWAGAGLGYDILNITVTDSSGATDGLGSLHGFVLNLVGGADFKPLPYVGIGPYAELTTGHYVSAVSTAIHGWLGFGLRARTAF